MSLPLALYYLTLQSLQFVQASPISPLNRRDASSCDESQDTRSISSIIWSCLATVFLCTWVAIHPNIPPPEKSIVTTLRRVGIMAMAVISPELVIMWAMRQWLVSRKLRKKYENMGWTQTHGFFALMGGFMLYEGDQPIRTLLPDELELLFLAGQIDFPHITEEEIKDRSKGDISKSGQTWKGHTLPYKVEKFRKISQPCEILALSDGGSSIWPRCVALENNCQT